jgi:hypothetical protein
MKAVVRQIFTLALAVVSIYIFCLVQGETIKSNAAIMAVLLSVVSLLSFPKTIVLKKLLIAEALTTVFIALVGYWFFKVYVL